MDKLLLYFPSDLFNKTARFRDDNGLLKVIEVKTIGSNVETTEIRKEIYNFDFAQITINRRGLLLACNPNLISGYTYFTDNYLTYNEFRNSVNYVEQELNQRGLELKIRDGKLRRYDFPFDITLNHHYKEYFPIISQLLPFIRNNTTKTYENSIYYGNRTRQVIIYDKTKEQLEKHAEIIPYNIARIEFRHLKAKRLNLELSFINDRKYYELRSNSKTFIADKLFNRNTQQVQNDIMDLLFNAINSNETVNGACQQFFFSGYHYLRLNGFDVETPFRVPRSNSNYSYLYRLKKLTQRDLAITTDYYKDLFIELKHKFQKVV